VLDSSLLASPQARWAPLSFLPDIFMLLFFMINPLLISISFPWVSSTSFIFTRRPSLGCILSILSWTDRRLTVSCLYSVYLSLRSGQLFNVGSFKPSFQQCLKNAHPQCARSCSRACSLAFSCALPLQTFASPPRTSVSGSVLSLANAATC
jgi:hypothetical protein